MQQILLQQRLQDFKESGKDPKHGTIATKKQQLQVQPLQYDGRAGQHQLRFRLLHQKRTHRPPHAQPLVIFFNCSSG